MTKYSKSVIDNVFNLYALGEPIERIAKQTGVNRNTIYAWREKYGWKFRADEITAQAIKQSGETIADIKKRQHLILKGIMAKFSEQLSNKNPLTQMKVAPSDIISTLKHELLLVGEAETKTEVSGQINAKSLADMYEEIYGDSKKVD